MLPVPDTDESLFPKGFDNADYHPVLVTAGLQADIQITPVGFLPLQIDHLSSASILVPFTDCTGDGESACNFPIKTLLGAEKVLGILDARPLVPGMSIFKG